MPWEQSGSYIRSGHRNLDEFKPHTFRTVWISEEEGIRAVVGKPKGNQGMEIVSFLFDVKKGWTLEKAKAWFEQHNDESKFNAHKEHFCFVTPILEKLVGKPLRIRGIAISAGMSRNFNIYLEDELKKFATKLINAPVYLEHVSALNAVGRVTSAAWNPSSKAVFYEAEVYDDETQEKIKRGLIQHVSVAADYERLDVVDGQVPHGLHNAELSLVAVPGMPQTNIQVVDDPLLPALMEKHIKNGRAIVAPEAMEQAKDEATDFSKTPFRDVMSRFSRLP
ncbi:MAG: hypothetical protein ACUVT5_03470 [Candidatus Bathyarchaeales archaeon]